MLKNNSTVNKDTVDDGLRLTMVFYSAFLVHLTVVTTNGPQRSK
jgi:hypothetical protein